MLIASAKARSARGASHQPAFMSGCVTIVYLVCMYLKEFICHCERGELGKVGE